MHAFEREVKWELQVVHYKLHKLSCGVLDLIHGEPVAEDLIADRLHRLLDLLEGVAAACQRLNKKKLLAQVVAARLRALRVRDTLLMLQ